MAEALIYQDFRGYLVADTTIPWWQIPRYPGGRYHDTWWQIPRYLVAESTIYQDKHNFNKKIQ